MAMQLQSWNQLSPQFKANILKLDKQMPYPWQESEWGHLPDRFLLSWVEVPGDKATVAAFALWEHLVWEDYAHLHKIVVDQPWRKKTLAGGLMQQSVENFRQQYACLRLGLEVSTLNFAARNFYEKHGWKTLNTIRGYYSNGEDAVRYQLLL
jgi:ribosomal protein S18 acetylase RimI-like enzyme